MILGILKEEMHQRVALSPKIASKLQELGIQCCMEKSAGLSSSFADEDYTGVTFMDRADLLKNSDILLSISPLDSTSWKELKSGVVLISLFEPFQDSTIVQKLEEKKLGAFSLDMIPRITLAQSMDVLSSMASIAGYQAAILSAQLLPRYFPMLMTAAGSIPPAKVLVLGAGVAGLQAIATAKRLGAVVEAFDVRSAAKEEVESLGAKFVEVEGATDDASAGGYAVEQSEEYKKRQQAEVQKRALASDVIITTAQLRGRPAPRLLLEETVRSMKSGSVIIDMAASSGGNCALSEDGKLVVVSGVQILGDSNLADRLAQDASRLFANNVYQFLKSLIHQGAWAIKPDDPIVEGAWITKGLPIQSYLK